MIDLTAVGFDDYTTIAATAAALMQRPEMIATARGIDKQTPAAILFQYRPQIRPGRGIGDTIFGIYDANRRRTD